MAGMGREMRRLMIAVSSSVILLVLAITGYFLVDVILTTEQNISDNKERMIQESVHALEETRNILVLSEFNPAYLEIFNKELTQRMVSGDLDLLYDFAVKVALLFYPVEYTSIIKDGEVVSSGAQSGWSVNPSELPTSPPREVTRCWTGWVTGRASSSPSSIPRTSVSSGWKRERSTPT